MKSSGISVALVGVSGFGEVHYRNLRDAAKKGQLRLAAATIINQQEEWAKCEELRASGCQLFDNYEAMLTTWQGRLDLCVIPTGIHHHAPMTQRALQAGCHVLVEKPAAGVIQDVDAMILAEKKAGKFVAVGYQHIYTPEIAAMKQAILDGLIGEVHALKCVGMWPRFDSYYTRNDWAGRLKSRDKWVLDAPFSNAFAHFLNLLCFLAGDQLQTSAAPHQIQAELYRSRLIESTDTACLRALTENGLPLLLWLTHSCPSVQGPMLEVRGTRGSLIWTESEILHRTSTATQRFRSVCNFDQSEHWMLQAVLNKIQNRNTFVCGLDIARNQTLCANGAFESSPIEVIDPDFLSVQHENAESLTVIDGIEDACHNAFTKELLWSEMAVPWARAGEEIDLQKYRSFRGDIPTALASVSLI